MRFKDSKELDFNIKAWPCALYTGDEAARKVILPIAKESAVVLDTREIRADCKVLSSQNVAAAECGNGRAEDLLQDGEGSLSHLTPKASGADRRVSSHPAAGKGDIKSCKLETVEDANISVEGLACAKKEDLLSPQDKNQYTAIKPNLPAIVSHVELERTQAFGRNPESRLQSKDLPSMQAIAENLTIDESYQCVEVQTANFVLSRNFSVSSKGRSFDPHEKSIRGVACSEHGNEQAAFSLHEEETLCEIETDVNKRDLSDFKRGCSVVDSVSLHQYATDRPTDYGNAHLYHREGHPWRNHMNCKESNQREQIIARLTKSRTKPLWSQ